MFRFLARSSAGTDVSFTGRAGRGLALSRRNERRAEERCNDKSRDCKFGSHQKGLLSYGTELNLGQAIEFRRAATSRKFAVFCALIKNSRFVITEHTPVTFRTNDLRKSNPIV